MLGLLLTFAIKDIIDVSSILESSQVMSSELQIDKLFTKMIEIVLESCNGSDFAVIATDFEDNGFALIPGEVKVVEFQAVQGNPTIRVIALGDQ